LSFTDWLKVTHGPNALATVLEYVDEFAEAVNPSGKSFFLKITYI